MSNIFRKIPAVKECFNRDETLKIANLVVKQHNELVDENEKLREDLELASGANEKLQAEITDLKITLSTTYRVNSENEKLQAEISHLRAKNKDLEEQYQESQIRLVASDAELYQSKCEIQRLRGLLEASVDRNKILNQLYNEALLRPATNWEVALELSKQIVVKAIQIEDNGAVITLKV